jgi:hypothetical protein
MNVPFANQTGDGCVSTAGGFNGFFFVFSKGNRSVVLLRTNPTRFYFRVKVLPEISFFALLAKGSSGTARFSTRNSFSTRDRMREWMNDLVALMW